MVIIAVVVVIVITVILGVFYQYHYHCYYNYYWYWYHHFSYPRGTDEKGATNTKTMNLRRWNACNMYHRSNSGSLRRVAIIFDHQFYGWPLTEGQRAYTYHYPPTYIHQFPITWMDTQRINERNIYTRSFYLKKILIYQI